MLKNKYLKKDVDDEDILDKTTHLKNECLLNPNEWSLMFDGCSKGNPGQAGCGAVIYRNGQEVWSSSKYLGKQTNNQAEYAGLIMGLEECVRLNLAVLKVQGDSLLIINQMNLKYMVHSPLLAPLNQMAKYLSSKIQTIKYEHVYRTENKRADELANMALVGNVKFELEIDPKVLDVPEIIPAKQTTIKDAIAKMFNKPKPISP